MKTLAEQLDCARRALGKRRAEYPKLVAAGRLRGLTAEHEIECMAAVVATLEKLWHLEQASGAMKADG